MELLRWSSSTHYHYAPFHTFTNETQDAPGREISSVLGHHQNRSQHGGERNNYRVCSCSRQFLTGPCCRRSRFMRGWRWTKDKTHLGRRNQSVVTRTVTIFRGRWKWGTWTCETWKCDTKLQGWEMRDIENARNAEYVKPKIQKRSSTWHYVECEVTCNLIGLLRTGVWADFKVGISPKRAG